MYVHFVENDIHTSELRQYYDTENISESKLAFRRATSEPSVHDVYDDTCTKILYNMEQ